MKISLNFTNETEKKRKEKKSKRFLDLLGTQFVYAYRFVVNCICTYDHIDPD